jgi:hypothetical protein
VVNAHGTTADDRPWVERTLNVFRSLEIAGGEMGIA